METKEEMEERRARVKTEAAEQRKADAEWCVKMAQLSIEIADLLQSKLSLDSGISIDIIFARAKAIYVARACEKDATPTSSDFPCS